MTKNCVCCKCDTVHDETYTVEHPPEFLVITINRFGQVLAGVNTKNKDKIKLDRNMMIASRKYDLIGSIHHHGSTIASGHYTRNVFYAESAYTCNDSHITLLNHFEPSDSVYMAFYALSS